MNDQQKYNDKTAQASLIIAASHDAAFVRTHPNSDDRAGAPVMVPTLALLAMIDRAAPDAMRSYLRERSDLIDAPDESCSTLEDMLPADLAAEAARYRVADVPEADSTEDVDERPAPATTERLALLGQIRDLYPNLPPSRHIGVVHWLLEGTVLIERVERLLDRPAR